MRRSAKCAVCRPLNNFPQTPTNLNFNQTQSPWNENMHKQLRGAAKTKEEPKQVFVSIKSVRSLEHKIIVIEFLLRVRLLFALLHSTTSSRTQRLFRGVNQNSFKLFCGKDGRFRCNSITCNLLKTKSESDESSRQGYNGPM